jgi:hypothetical protein
MALTALTTPPVPRRRRTLPERDRSNVTGPLLDANTRVRPANSSRTSRRRRFLRCLMVILALSTSILSS